MADGNSVLIGNRILALEDLRGLPTPEATATHRPIAHFELVTALIETLSFRHIGIHRSEFTISQGGNKLFGLMELDQTFTGARFAVGLRNSHDKSMRLALTVGYRVFVCENMAFHGDFTPVLAKHSKNFNLKHALSTGVDDMQRHLEPMVQSVKLWQEAQLTDDEAKLWIFRAFIEEELDAPKHVARAVWQGWQTPVHAEFQPRTMFSLHNCFTGAFQTLEPIPKFKATASLARFMQ